MKKELATQVNAYLANIGVSYIKLHNLHWNVVGSQFKAAHEYLETLYDAIAELLKMNGEAPLASMKGYLSVATIPELESVELDVKSAMQTVLKDMESLRTQAFFIREQADKENQFDVVAHMEDDVANYNKTIWFIQSMLK